MASFGPLIYQVARNYAQQTSRLWLNSATKGDFPAGKNKCNLFVYDVIVEAGVRPPPSVSKILWFGSRMPTAQEWSDPNVTIENWLVVSEPAPGDVVAIGFDDNGRPGATGHVGICGGNNTTISAASNQAGRVIQNDWGFRPTMRPTFRRCGLEAPEPRGGWPRKNTAARTA
ncbi:MAG: hypothetical protein ACRC33_25030 [Gemmataceae bacterium]